MGDRTSSSITINASKSRIIEVIANFSSYPTWAEGIKRADVMSTGELDRAAQVRFRLEAGPIKDTYVLAYKWEGDDAVTWDMAEPGKMISSMSGAYRLVDKGDSTEVTYDLAVEASLLRMGIIKRKTEKMIADMALRDLKRQVEG